MPREMGKGNWFRVTFGKNPKGHPQPKKGICGVLVLALTFTVSAAAAIIIAVITGG